jgi:isopenicillin-N N-acyltransferase-like protein
MSGDKIPLIEVSGDNYEIGYQIGKKLKKQIAKTIKFPEEVAEAHNLYKIGYFEKLAEKYFPYANKVFPELISELKGMADGSEQEFNKLWLLNVEEVLFDRYFDKCTTIITRNKENILLGHNEDFYKGFKDNLAFVRGNLDNGTSFLGLTFAGMICGSSVSINSNGITQAINSLTPLDTQVGVPKNFIARKSLEIKNVNELLNLLKIQNRSSGYCHNIIKNNKIYCIESTAKNYFVAEVKKNYFVHANDYLSKIGRGSESKPLSFSRRVLLNDYLSRIKNIDESGVKSLLSFRNKKIEVCRHEDKNEEDMTLASAYIDVGTNTINLIKGQPCKGKYYSYSLD